LVKTVPRLLVARRLSGYPRIVCDSTAVAVENDDVEPPELVDMMSSSSRKKLCSLPNCGQPLQEKHSLLISIFLKTLYQCPDGGFDMF
jgi:hypothetical protein